MVRGDAGWCGVCPDSDLLEDQITIALVEQLPYYPEGNSGVPSAATARFDKQTPSSPSTALLSDSILSSSDEALSPDTADTSTSFHEQAPAQQGYGDEEALWAEAPLGVSGKCEQIVPNAALSDRLVWINQQLCTRGFRDIPSRIEGAARTAKSTDQWSQLVTASWSSCSEVMQAYDAQRRRLRDACLEERRTERVERDTRIQQLLKENERLKDALSKQRQEQPPSAPIPPSVLGATANRKEQQLQQLRRRWDQTAPDTTPSYEANE